MTRWRPFASVFTHPLATALLGALLGFILLSGCVATEEKWTHDKIPADEWSVDAAQCKWEARRKAEREAEEDMTYSSDNTFDDEQSVDSMFAAADIKKRSRVFFSRCMRSLGYIPAE